MRTIYQAGKVGNTPATVVKRRSSHRARPTRRLACSRADLQLQPVSGQLQLLRHRQLECAALLAVIRRRAAEETERAASAEKRPAGNDERENERERRAGNDEPRATSRPRSPGCRCPRPGRELVQALLEAGDVHQARAGRVVDDDVDRRRERDAGRDRLGLRRPAGCCRRHGRASCTRPTRCPGSRRRPTTGRAPCRTTSSRSPPGSRPPPRGRAPARGSAMTAGAWGRPGSRHVVVLRTVVVMSSGDRLCGRGTEYGTGET